MKSNIDEDAAYKTKKPTTPTIQILRKPIQINYMHTSHPAFRPPPDIDGKIWQYMELAEFVSMLN